MLSKFTDDKRKLRICVTASLLAAAILIAAHPRTMALIPPPPRYQASHTVLPFTCGQGSTADIVGVPQDGIGGFRGSFKRSYIINVATAANNQQQRAGYLLKVNTTKSIVLERIDYNLYPSRRPGWRQFACAFDAPPGTPLDKIVVRLMSDDKHVRDVRFSQMNVHVYNSRTPNQLRMINVPGNWRVASITNTQLGGFGTRSQMKRIAVFVENDGLAPRTVRFGGVFCDHSNASNPDEDHISFFHEHCSALENH